MMLEFKVPFEKQRELESLPSNNGWCAFPLSGFQGAVAFLLVAQNVQVARALAQVTEVRAKSSELALEPQTPISTSTLPVRALDHPSI